MAVPLIEDGEGVDPSAGEFSATGAGSGGDVAVRATSRADPQTASPAITIYRANGSPIVLDRETLQFWLMVFQTLALLALVVQEVRR